jgi:arsenate reductase
MRKVQVWHNTRCSKSRDAFQWLEKNKIDFEWVDYMKDSIDKTDLKVVLKKLNIKPQELLRTKEKVYVTEFGDKKMTANEAIDAMVKYPQLIERPIIVKGDEAVIARPLEKMIKLFVAND